MNARSSDRLTAKPMSWSIQAKQSQVYTQTLIQDETDALQVELELNLEEEERRMAEEDWSKYRKGFRERKVRALALQSKGSECSGRLDDQGITLRSGPEMSQTQHKKRHARLKNSKSSTTRSHVVATITTTTLLQYTFDGQVSILKMKICRLFAFILLATTICQLAVDCAQLRSTHSKPMSWSIQAKQSQDETESIPTNDGHTLRS
ncbi:hypothetical protein T03_9270 [Trichinella britovi]|uniref:Uncharacterized protein n=1 Tax=Trichinella britovi TaxID=45882 RepID=A0A0V1C7H5_TRIBR|nr:hypothetical protein T03_9270 [Trichinella britovi]